MTDVQLRDAMSAAVEVLPRMRPRAERNGDAIMVPSNEGEYIRREDVLAVFGAARLPRPRVELVDGGFDL